MAELNTGKKKSDVYLFLASVLTVLFWGGRDFYTNKTVNLFKMFGHDCGIKAACLGVKKGCRG